MSTPASNTKVEILAEAIENMALAVAAAVAEHRPPPKGPQAAYDNVMQARKAVADALREFLQPTLRVVEGNGG